MSFVDAYVDFARAFCHAPDLFHRFAALNALSAVIGPRLRMPWGDKWIYPNLWLLFLADSTLSAKTTAMNISSRLLQDVHGTNLFPQEFSREKLVQIIGERKCGTFMVSEFSQFMGMMRANYNEGVLGFLTDIYDVPDMYRRSTKSGEFELKQPCINILACSTPDFMSANEEEWASGFGPRFMLIPCESDRFIAVPPRSDRKERERLRRFLENAKSIHGEVEFCDVDQYAEWATKNWKILKGQARIERSWGARMGIYVIKLAILLEVSAMDDLWSAPRPDAEGDGFIGGETFIPLQRETVGKAIALCEWVARRQMEAYFTSSVSQTPYSKIMQKVLDAIKHYGSGEAKRSEVLNRTRLKAKVLDEALTTLEQRNVVRRDWKKVGSRRQEFYHLTDPGADEEADEERTAIQEEGNPPPPSPPDMGAPEL